MKKIVLLATMTMFSLVSFAQDTTKTVIKDSSQLKEFADSSKVTFSKVYNDAKAAIIGLAGALKVGAEHVYEVLVKQQIVNSCVYLFLFSFSLILMGFFIRAYNNKSEAWSSEDGVSPTFMGVIRVFQLVISFIMLVVGIFNIDTILTGFINPEYGALKDIMDFVK